MVMLVAATAIAGAVALTRGDVAYMLVIAWAFVGIAVKHAATAAVATTAWVMTTLVLVLLAAGVVVQRRQRQ